MSITLTRHDRLDRDGFSLIAEELETHKRIEVFIANILGPKSYQEELEKFLRKADAYFGYTSDWDSLLEPLAPSRNIRSHMIYGYKTLRSEVATASTYDKPKDEILVSSVDYQKPTLWNHFMLHVGLALIYLSNLGTKKLEENYANY